eukprot:CAMPEP_0168563038 /NCGR_PEP_ID=MMETSP0413-20121227/12454_1 /TAXON_ID=136452 /ORGANISM="Filamoeba nolandi, Strain NC-AS-23-1" /LENGTH=44 /DNA_ID= /DNA_START= /DNA_END= /DNA_ORIENTATION=
MTCVPPTMLAMQVYALVSALLSVLLLTNAMMLVFATLKLDFALI